MIGSSDDSWLSRSEGEEERIADFSEDEEGEREKEKKKIKKRSRKERSRKERRIKKKSGMLEELKKKRRRKERKRQDKGSGEEEEEEEIEDSEVEEGEEEEEMDMDEEEEGDQKRSRRRNKREVKNRQRNRKKLRAESERLLREQEVALPKHIAPTLDFAQLLGNTAPPSSSSSPHLPPPSSRAGGGGGAVRAVSSSSGGSTLPETNSNSGDITLGGGGVTAHSVTASIFKGFTNITAVSFGKKSGPLGPKGGASSIIYQHKTLLRRHSSLAQKARNKDVLSGIPTLSGEMSTSNTFTTPGEDEDSVLDGDASQDGTGRSGGLVLTGSVVQTSRAQLMRKLKRMASQKRSMQRVSSMNTQELTDVNADTEQSDSVRGTECAVKEEEYFPEPNIGLEIDQEGDDSQKEEIENDDSDLPDMQHIKEGGATVSEPLKEVEGKERSPQILDANPSLESTSCPNVAVEVDLKENGKAGEPVESPEQPVKDSSVKADSKDSSESTTAKPAEEKMEDGVVQERRTKTLKTYQKKRVILEAEPEEENKCGISSPWNSPPQETPKESQDYVATQVLLPQDTQEHPEESQNVIDTQVLPEESQDGVATQVLPDVSQNVVPTQVLPEESQKVVPTQVLPEDLQQNVANTQILPEESQNSLTTEARPCQDNVTKKDDVQKRHLPDLHDLEDEDDEESNLEPRSSKTLKRRKTAILDDEDDENDIFSDRTEEEVQDEAGFYDDDEPKGGRNVFVDDCAEEDDIEYEDEASVGNHGDQHASRSRENRLQKMLCDEDEEEEGYDEAIEDYEEAIENDEELGVDSFFDDEDKKGMKTLRKCGDRKSKKTKPLPEGMHWMPISRPKKGGNKENEHDDEAKMEEERKKHMAYAEKRRAFQKLDATRKSFLATDAESLSVLNALKKRSKKFAPSRFSSLSNVGGGASNGASSNTAASSNGDANVATYGGNNAKKPGVAATGKNPFQTIFGSKLGAKQGLNQRGSFLNRQLSGASVRALKENQKQSKHRTTGFVFNTGSNAGNSGGGSGK
eukprot:Nk52_evm2s521 gene=Nk52_evmTU2s521